MMPQGHPTHCGCEPGRNPFFNPEPAASLLRERAKLAQPAEAEGVDFGFDDRSVKVSQEAYSIFLDRERHHLAALSAVTAERDAERRRADVAVADANDAERERDQLRAELQALRDLVGQCVELLNLGRQNSIASGSILHRSMAAAVEDK